MTAPAPAHLAAAWRLARPLAGGFCLATGLLLLGRPEILERRGPEAIVPPAQAAVTGASRAGAVPRPRRGEVIGRLRIARLGLDSVVAEGTDDAVLDRGPGHMEGSALPGEPDNCIIAGHRTGAFRRLESVRRGDLIEIEDGRGLWRYRVTGTRIVERDDAVALAPSRDAHLTLVTCYPFRHVGPAPRRYVVRAVPERDGTT